MPECKFGMNDKLLMEKEQKSTKVDRGINISDLKFHQCVRLGKFDKDRSITFIPPDGQFDLMTYRITENINLPFKIMPIFNELPKNGVGRTRIECIVKLKSIFDSSLFG
jgi:AP-2 complex subunit mu-1